MFHLNRPFKLNTKANLLPLIHFGLKPANRTSPSLLTGNASTRPSAWAPARPKSARSTATACYRPRLYVFAAITVLHGTASTSPALTRYYLSTAFVEPYR